MTVFLLEYDPSGRSGAAGYERTKVEIENKVVDDLSDFDALVTGMRYIASAYCGVHIEYIDVYQQLNE